MTTNSHIVELKTLEEAAAWLRVKKEWFYQRICAGTLPFPYIKVGNHLRFSVDGIQQYLESQTRNNKWNA